MAFERTRDSADKSTRSLRRCGTSVVGVVLIASVFGVSSAPATLLEEGGGADGPATATLVPSLPSPLPRVTPPAPVGTPTVPRVPVNHVPVEVPTGVTPTSSPSSHLSSTPSGSATKVLNPGADSPSIGGTTSAGKDSADRVASTSTETAQRAAASARSDVGADSNSPSGRSVESAEVAVPRRWFAHVWPAIALGRIGKGLATLMAGWEGATLLPVSDAARLFSRLTGIIEDSDAPPQSPATNGSPAPPPVASMPASGGMSLFLTMITSLLALIGLIALARLAVGEEFFSSLRWPQ